MIQLNILSGNIKHNLEQNPHFSNPRCLIPSTAALRVLPVVPGVYGMGRGLDVTPVWHQKG